MKYDVMLQKYYNSMVAAWLSDSTMQLITDRFSFEKGYIHG